jgi:hypothetical protein
VTYKECLKLAKFNNAGPKSIRYSVGM